MKDGGMKARRGTLSHDEASVRTMSTQSAPSDPDLLARLRAGDEAAFEMVLARHHHSLVRLATLFVSDAGAAEEVAQEDAAATDGWFASSGSWARPPGQWAAATPEELVLRAETHAALESAIAALPAVQRAVITMRDVEGFPAEDVCNVLELSETNQRVLLHRARTRIRAALSEHMSGR
jgi:RNA polymerase sigma-70 factor, ECF subfamily